MKCVYCADGTGATADHVPPRSFFGKSPPPNLITVPCCEDCRIRDQKDDQFIRNLFVSVNFVESHPAVANELAGRRDKSMYETKGMGARMLAKLIRVPVRDANGKVVRYAPGFDFNDPRIARFLERISRGVIYAAHQKSHFPASFSFVLQPGMPMDIMARAEDSIPQRAVGDIFHYFITETDDGDWFVLMTFFQSLQMLGKLTRPRKS